MRYALYDTPVPKGRKNLNTKHARVVADSKVDMEKLCKLVSAGSSFSAADVKGILEAFKHWLGVYLVEGSTVEMEGLGHFYPTLKSTVEIDEKGSHKVHVRVDTVSFRCSPELKKMVREAELIHEKRPEREKIGAYQRKENILNYIRDNVAINTTTIMQLNHCNRHVALNDMKVLMAEGKVLKAGKGKLSIYILPYH